MKFYCNEVSYASAKSGRANRLQLHFTKDEIDHLGGLGAQLELKAQAHGTILQPTGQLNKLPKICEITGGTDGHYWGVSFMHADFPYTGLTTLPYQKQTTSLLLQPQKAELVPIRSPLKKRRAGVKVPTNAPLATVTSNPTPVPRRGKRDPLADLRTALALIHEEARRVGAELYFDDKHQLRARIVI